MTRQAISTERESVLRRAFSTTAGWSSTVARLVLALGLVGVLVAQGGGRASIDRWLGARRS